MIRILAHYNEFTGSHYHRIHLPVLHLERHFSQFQITRKEEIKEIDFANCDIFYYNRFVKMNPFNLNYLRKKYGFKVVIDMDDKVYIPRNHYMYNFYEQQKIPEKIIANLVNADYIICSTEYLADNLKEYNSNIIVIPNAIDFEIEQFKFKEKQDSDKLRIVYPCSLSHVHDVKLLEQSFKRIKSDGFVSKNTLFTLAGYNETNKQTKDIWMQMIKVYKNLSTHELAHSLTTDQYMRHYDNKDVCIIPLEVNDFNKSKSILKVLETGAKKLVAIASDVEPYNLMPKGYYLPVNNAIDWYKHVKELIKSKEMVQEYSEKLYEYVLTEYNMNKVNNLRKELFESISLSKVDTKNTKIISICYADNQISEYETYRNTVNSIEQKSYLFEYNPIIDIITNNLYDINKYDYIGIFSWKFPLKSGFSEREIYYNIDNEHDVYTFVRPVFKTGKEYFDFSDKFHGGLLNILKNICNDLNIEYTDSPEYVVYSNFYITRYDIMKDYIYNYIIPAIDLLETKYRDEAWQDSKYRNLKLDDLKKYTGLTYYPKHSFILERMFSIYLHNNNRLKVKICSGSY